MNHENFESKSEQFPSKEIVLDEINKHAEGLELNVTKELSDDTGIYFLEMVSENPDSEGYIREYTYSRKSLKTEEDLPPKVYVAYFEDGMPVGGEEVFSF